MYEDCLAQPLLLSFLKCLFILVTAFGPAQSSAEWCPLSTAPPAEEDEGLQKLGFILCFLLPWRLQWWCYIRGLSRTEREGAVHQRSWQSQIFQVLHMVAAIATSYCIRISGEIKQRILFILKTLCSAADGGVLKTEKAKALVPESYPHNVGNLAGWSLIRVECACVRVCQKPLGFLWECACILTGMSQTLCLLRTVTKKQFYPHVLGEIWDFLRQISPVSTDFYLSGFICHV